MKTAIQSFMRWLRTILHYCRAAALRIAFLTLLLECLIWGHSYMAADALEHKTYGDESPRHFRNELRVCRSYAGTLEVTIDGYHFNTQSVDLLPVRSDTFYHLTKAPATPLGWLGDWSFAPTFRWNEHREKPDPLNAGGSYFRRWVVPHCAIAGALAVIASALLAPFLFRRKTTERMPVHRRILRSVFRYSAGISTFLFLLTLVLGIRSIWTIAILQPCWVHRSPSMVMGDILTIRLSGGGVELSHAASTSRSLLPDEESYGTLRAGEEVASGYPANADLGVRPTLGFAYYRGTPSVMRVPFFMPLSSGSLVTLVIFPVIFPLLLFAALPLLYVRSALLPRRRVAYRVRRGLCTHCGYDLNATPNRCPECGNVPAPLARS